MTLACYDYLSQWFDLLLIGLVLTIVALFGVILIMALKWPRPRSQRHDCNCGGQTTVEADGHRWGWHRGSCPRVDEPFGSGPVGPGKIERCG
jgi:hypothetical protein